MFFLKSYPLISYQFLYNKAVLIKNVLADLVRTRNQSIAKAMHLTSDEFKSQWNTLLDSVKNTNEKVSQIKMDTGDMNEQMAKLIKEYKELKSEIAEIKKDVVDLRDRCRN